jgi:hypothetical protein
MWPGQTAGRCSPSPSPCSTSATQTNTNSMRRHAVRVKSNKKGDEQDEKTTVKVESIKQGDGQGCDSTFFFCLVINAETDHWVIPSYRGSP